MIDTTAPAMGARMGGKRYRRFGLHNLRMGFRQWRKSRPFWAGFWSLLGGLLIAYIPATAFKFILYGQAIWVGIAVGIAVGAFGILLWLQPQFRYMLGVLIILLSLASFITSDFGGLILGMLMGLIGGSLAMAWVPNPPLSWRERRRERRLAMATGGAGALAVTGTPVSPLAPERPLPEMSVHSEAVEPAGAPQEADEDAAEEAHVRGIRRFWR